MLRGNGLEVNGIVENKWDELERWLDGQRLPKGFDVMKEPDWVEKFVRKMMTKSLPSAANSILDQADENEGLSFFETHQDLLVKFHLPREVSRENLRLYVRDDRLRIEGLPNQQKEIIKLPKLVKPTICQAVVKNYILQVKLRKRPKAGTYYETDIRWLKGR
ncbi:Hsp20/alpha crystallin family protein [Paenibacillus sp. BK720]|uniref:Hsp20/alpha crystallin family protein n=1 Tax=Paenibacillus sp. BK720 TaxID=2587092 RepID=UPI001ABB260A|nr:Hsp20/alpha crystallin family protein [Paenibacillus sp. BK720]